MKLVSLFDGIGGFALGFCRATGQDPKDFHYYASEIEKFPMAATRKNFPKVEELGDVKTVQGERLRASELARSNGDIPDQSDDATCGRGYDHNDGGECEGRDNRIRPKTSDEQGQPEQPATGRPVPLPTQGWDSDTDFICSFGSPCQDLSVAGKQQGLDGERSGLFYEAIRVVRELRPKYFVWENVAGAFSSNNREDFASVIQAIADIGYDSCYTVLDAQWFGVPQRRRRIFLVGVRDGIPAGTDLLAFSRRATPACREQISLITKSRGGNSKESGKARQETPDHPQESPGGRSFVIDRAAFNQGENALYEPRIEEGDVMSSLMSRGPHAVGQNPDPVAMEAGQSVAGTLTSGGANAGNRSDIGNCGALPLENPDPVAFDGYNQTVDDTTQSCRASRSDADHVGMVAYNDPVIMRPCYVRNGRGAPEVGGVCPPIHAEGGTTSDMRPVVAYDIQTNDGGQHKRKDRPEGGMYVNETDTSLTIGSPDQTRIVATIMAHGQPNAEISREACPTLNCNHEQPIATITHAAPVAPIIRRLTPVECLHLQGFPSDYFDDVPGYSDTQAYKAIGNSIAVPCVEWIFRRILEFDNDHAG
tara:strand:- start:2244 stop:4019 length:1776 start_codon:yes stop_codon:yes gene_type:complete